MSKSISALHFKNLPILTYGDFILKKQSHNVLIHIMPCSLELNIPVSFLACRTVALSVPTPNRTLPWPLGQNPVLAAGNRIGTRFRFLACVSKRTIVRWDFFPLVKARPELIPAAKDIKHTLKRYFRSKHLKMMWRRWDGQMV